MVGFTLTSVPRRRSAVPGEVATGAMNRKGRPAMSINCESGWLCSCMPTLRIHRHCCAELHILDQAFCDRCMRYRCRAISTGSNKAHWLMPAPPCPPMFFGKLFQHTLVLGCSGYFSRCPFGIPVWDIFRDTPLRCLFGIPCFGGTFGIPFGILFRDAPWSHHFVVLASIDFFM